MKVPQGLAGKLGVLWLVLACVPSFAAAGVLTTGADAGGSPGERTPSLEATAADVAEHHNDKAFHHGHPLAIQHGVLTVDGLTVKAGINTRVSDLQYMYVCVPGTGAVVVAEHPFSGAREEPAAFQGRTLTFLAGTSRVQLTAANRMRTNESVYTRFEPGEMTGVRIPMLGFGDAALLPAVWSPNGAATPAGRRRSRSRARRVLRTAKLCRPSPKGREACAMIREVVYER